MADQFKPDGDQLVMADQLNPDATEEEVVVPDRVDIPDSPPRPVQGNHVKLDGEGQPMLSGSGPEPEHQGEAPAAEARDVEGLRAQLVASRASLHRQVDAWAKAQEDVILQFFTTGSVPIANGGSPPAKPAPLRVRKELAVAKKPPAAPVRAAAEKETPQTEAPKEEEKIPAQGELVKLHPTEGAEEALAMHKQTIAAMHSKMLGHTHDLSGIKATLGKVLFAKAFECSMAAVIVSHVFFMAWQANYNMSQAVIGRNELNITVLVIEVLFNSIYTVELALRIVVLQTKFIASEDWNWNLLDSLLVVTSWYDIVASVSSTDRDESNISQLRILRLMKMLKLLRMIQLMRAFRELRLIINSMMSCMKTMVWAVLLILSVAFMFGICFVQASTNFVKDNAGDPAIPELLSRWGTVPKSILSLYIASMGGADWEDIAMSLMPTGWPYYYLFLMYIGFFFCVVTNTLTSLFVESAMSVSDKDQAAIIHAELEKKDKYMQKLKTWYQALDEDDSGEVSLDEFLANAHHPDMLAFALSMEISITELQQFFKVLSANGKRTVNMERFIVGCIKLRGTAKSMDLMDLYYAHRETSEKLADFIDDSHKEFFEMRSAIVSLSGLLARILNEPEDVIPI